MDVCSENKTTDWWCSYQSKLFPFHSSGPDCLYYQRQLKKDEVYNKLHDWIWEVQFAKWEESRFRWWSKSPLWKVLFLAGIVSIGVILPAGSTDNLTSSCYSLLLFLFLRLNLDPNFKTSGQWNRVDPIYRYIYLFIQWCHLDWWCYIPSAAFQRLSNMRMKSLWHYTMMILGFLKSLSKKVTW
jgi:hypothetical protein